MHVCSISAADGDDTQSSVSDSHLPTCSTEAEPGRGAREEKQGKESTSQSSREISDALPQEYAAVGANLPIVDESDTRKSTEGIVSIVTMHNGVI